MTYYERAKNATHCYIGVKPCGCVVGIVTDTCDKSTADYVAGFIRDGLTVERVTFEHYREHVKNSPGFMACPHGQLSLFSDGEAPQ